MTGFLAYDLFQQTGEFRRKGKTACLIHEPGSTGGIIDVVLRFDAVEAVKEPAARGEHALAFVLSAKQ